MKELDFYNKAGKEIGWDFSQIQVTMKGEAWNFYEEVTKQCRETDSLLDIGTGSGEKVINLADKFYLIVGIDQSASMIEKARENLKNAEVTNVNFFQMIAENIDFPERSFSCITSRHAPFEANEVVRLLTDDGVFYTQQVSEADKINLKESFGLADGISETDGELKQRYLAELESAGFTNIQAYDYNAVEYYQRPEDLLFLLSHTPIIPNFGNNKKNLEKFNEFVHLNQTDLGIQTNEKRFMIIARK
ncbi:class I SAM-dependent methyltransferase [Gracilibacillus oryzae]|uniref:Class I SAM-dependent methyltransferase n=1 Tax=Gracilibacillus oryzae TaxID=1672701 RepID=A0A7C8GTF5_9BACI|nr:class I SAM-dependent methyltransferase [Gracilibacillus oryzae]KAB8135786.1 class I SAM-dependent methyltransferase [Gracilibacillus oryzae]